METKPYQRVWLEEAAPGETFIYKEGKAEREDVQNADIILGNVSPKLISTGDKLKWLQTNSAGVDGYIHGCLPKETVLTNATGAYGLAISEYMVAVWLELLKKLHLYSDVQRTGKWCDLGQVRSAWNSTVLVLGLGDIGGEFAKRAKALGARVIGVRRTGTDKPDFVDELIHTDKLDEYLPQADCVAITLPGTTATKGMFDAERMAKMKDGAILANAGHFNVEIDMAGLEAACVAKKELRENIMGYQLANGKWVDVIAEGRLVNIAAADGHPAEIMDLSFAVQAMSALYIMRNRGKLDNTVIDVSGEIDDIIARRKLAAWGIEIDSLTPEQQKYLNSWKI